MYDMFRMALTAGVEDHCNIPDPARIRRTGAIHRGPRAGQTY